MRILDLFCGAGGAAMGYHRAGFDVVGVDKYPQPNYPFEFVQGDVFKWCADNSIGSFDAIHASPPCQAYSTTVSLHNNTHPQLVEPTRDLLKATGLLYVMENVVGAPFHNYFRLCGSSFGLRVWRHRLFEANWEIGMVPPCSHVQHPLPLDVTGVGGPGGRHRKPSSLAQAQEALGIDWMKRKELSQAIPPDYTEFIGRQLMREVLRHAA